MYCYIQCTAQWADLPKRFTPATKYLHKLRQRLIQKERIAELDIFRCAHILMAIDSSEECLETNKQTNNSNNNKNHHPQQQQQHQQKESTHTHTYKKQAAKDECSEKKAEEEKEKKKNKSEKKRKTAAAPLYKTVDVTV